MQRNTVTETWLFIFNIHRFWKLSHDDVFRIYSETCLKRPLKQKTKIGFQDQLLLNVGQKYYRMLSTFIKLPFAIKTFDLSIFEWLLKTGFTEYIYLYISDQSVYIGYEVFMY